MAQQVNNPSANAGDVGDVDLTPLLEDLLEKGMVAHSSILVWEIPWTNEPGRLWFMRSQRVEHD